MFDYLLASIKNKTVTYRLLEVTIVLVTVTLTVALWRFSGETFFSVEFGLAELSPNGEEGGYAMPASGASTPTGLRHSCSPDGNSVTLSWNRSSYQSSYKDNISPLYTQNDTPDTPDTTWVNILGPNIAHAGGGGGGFTHSHSVPAPVTYSVYIGTHTFCGGSMGSTNWSWPSLIGADIAHAGGGGTVDCRSIDNLSSNSHSVSIEPDRTYYWRVNACSGGGCSSSYSVGQAPASFACAGAPTLNFSADSYSVPYDTGTTLNWSSTNTSSCTASGAWSGSKATSGNEATGNLRKQTSYFLQCTGPRGDTQPKVATINVIHGTGADISACKNFVYKNEEFCLNYNVGTSAPEHCVVKAGNTTIQGPLTQSSGSINWAITGETTFTLDCEEGGNTDSATVRVLPEFQET